MHKEDQKDDRNATMNLQACMPDMPVTFKVRKSAGQLEIAQPHSLRSLYRARSFFAPAPNHDALGSCPPAGELALPANELLHIKE